LTECRDAKALHCNLSKLEKNKIIAAIIFLVEKDGRPISIKQYFHEIINMSGFIRIFCELHSPILDIVATALNQ